MLFYSILIFFWEYTFDYSYLEYILNMGRKQKPNIKQSQARVQDLCKELLRRILFAFV